MRRGGCVKREGAHSLLVVYIRFTLFGVKNLRAASCLCEAN